MRRALALFAALLALPTAGATAGPAPVSDPRYLAEAAITLTTPRHVWTVTFDAYTSAPPGSSENGLKVWVQDGAAATGASRLYSSALPASAVTVGTDSASVSTRLGGVPVVLSWRVPRGLPPSIVLTTTDAGAGRGAPASVQIGPSSCVSPGASLGVEMATLRDLQPPDGSLSAAFPGGLKGARCSEVVRP